ncbi:hypothetical protein K435DRAFT_224676 [Dendrothele bispora CBS 962.96]|uniref:Uncharacterized protein n=1 Tax=Dendrothele bispora (strain CBS 962.96) TaxID=1314807 RepID=A0A4S8LQT2_DENBC|nr:hypothetical protein K435DRAFT_224676 [Dendrothele bispora CBS 962.96]
MLSSPPPPSPTLSYFQRDLFAPSTPIPTQSCCPSAVVLQIQTAVLIPDYNRFYDEPPSNFDPHYIPIADGSLVTPVFANDLAYAYRLLLLLGLLAMLFFSNLVASVSHLGRARTCSKMLFRTLVISQFLAFASVMPVIFSFFLDSVDCTAVLISTHAAGFLSLTLLMSGIYGVKVYKCLENSVFVLVVLVLSSCAITAVAVLDLTRVKGIHRISGSCTRANSWSLTSLYLLLQFAQSLFICLCFLYAVWKSRNSPVARGRMSIRLSMDESTPQDQQDLNEVHSGRRGWWDYVPTREPTPPSPHPDGFSIIRSLQAVFSRLFYNRSNAVPLERGHSVVGRHSGPDYPHLSQDRTSDRSNSKSRDLPPVDTKGRLSPAPSSSSRFSRYIPRMELFRNVCYTAIITACHVLVAILSIVGLNFTSGLPVTGWISLNWAVASILTVHSFGRVVRRHERDHYIQLVANWCGGRAGYERSRERTVTRHKSPYRRLRGVMGGESVDQDNPFDETRALTQSCLSWDSRFSHISRSPSSPSEASSIVRSPSSQMLPVSIPSPTAQFPTASRRTTQSSL